MFGGLRVLQGCIHTTMWRNAIVENDIHRMSGMIYQVRRLWQDSLHSPTMSQAGIVENDIHHSSDKNYRSGGSRRTRRINGTMRRTAITVDSICKMRSRALQIATTTDRQGVR